MAKPIFFILRELKNKLKKRKNKIPVNTLKDPALFKTSKISDSLDKS